MLSDGRNASAPPANVPREARINDPSNEPHCRNALPRILVPSNNNGVANVSDILCRNELALDPPGGNSVFQVNDDVVVAADAVESLGIQPTLDRTNVSAIADTGAPNNLPIMVDLPNN